MQVKVLKTDGTVEDYLSTKVLRTFYNAFDSTEQDLLFTAAELTEAITYFIYQQQSSTITSSEIFSIIQAALAATGFEDAAMRLGEYHIKRLTHRQRIEVTDTELSEASVFYEKNSTAEFCVRWNKTIIARGIEKRYRIEQPVARAIASAVEEKVLNMETKSIPRSLLRQLVFAEAKVMLEAANQLTIKRKEEKNIYRPAVSASRADTDIRLETPQNGLCETPAVQEV